MSDKDCLDTQQQRELEATVTEFHIRYVQERILLDSDLIFDLVRSGRLQVQGAVVQWDGTVRFIGGHPDFTRVADQRARIDRHRRKGFKLGPRQLETKAK